MWVESEKVVYHHNCRNEILEPENCSFSYYFSHSAWANILHILYLCNDILWIANEGTQQVIEPEVRILDFVFKIGVQQQQRLSLYNKTMTYAINLISYFLLVNQRNRRKMYAIIKKFSLSFLAKHAWISIFARRISIYY